MANQQNGGNGQKKTKPSSSDDRRQMIRLIAVVVLVVCVIGISFYFVRWNKNRTLNKEIADLAEESIEDDLMDFTKLQKENPDIYAWIRIPGTEVDYPILQHESDTPGNWYYLERTVDGTEGLPGSLFTEPRNAKDFSDPLTVVYGHNMRDGSMFASLHNYEDLTFMEENPYIYIYTPEKNYIYQVYTANVYDSKLILDYYNDFLNIEDMDLYLSELAFDQDATYNWDISYDTNDKFITLSTCTSSVYGDDTRFTVTGVMLDDAEKQAVLKANEEAEASGASDSEEE